MNWPRFVGGAMRRLVSLRGDQHMRLDPLLFGMKSFRSKSEWSQHGPTKRRKISPPTTIGIGFDPTGTLDRQGTESLKIDGFAVKAADLTIGLNDGPHPAAIRPEESR